MSLQAKWEGIVAKSHRLKHYCIGCKLQWKIFFVARSNELQLIEDNTWLRGDMEFIFECSTVRYRVEHEKRNFISPSNHVLFCFFYKPTNNTNNEVFYDFPKISDDFKMLSVVILMFPNIF